MEEITKILGNGQNVAVIVQLSDLREFGREIAERARMDAENAQKSKDLLTGVEVKNLLSIKSTSLWRWKQRGLLNPIKIGGRVLYQRGEIEELLKKGGTE